MASRSLKNVACPGYRRDMPMRLLLCSITRRNRAIRSARLGRGAIWNIPQLLISLKRFSRARYNSQKLQLGTLKLGTRGMSSIARREAGVVSLIARNWKVISICQFSRKRGFAPNSPTSPPRPKCPSSAHVRIFGGFGIFKCGGDVSLLSNARRSLWIDYAWEKCADWTYVILVSQM